MNDLEEQLIVGFGILSEIFAKNIWLGVGSTIIFILGLIGLRILDKKHKWSERLKKGSQSIKDVSKESTQNEENITNGDDWDPKP